jgi:aspartyl-tRNA(Asn)/glutamyl-tRNA(Gln) amidotransferase subunit C
MAVDTNDLLRVAALARLGLEPDRVRVLVEELNGILAHMEELQAVDTSMVELEGEDHGLTTGRRPDVPQAVRIDAAAFAPRMVDGFFVVPRLASHDDE